MGVRGVIVEHGTLHLDRLQNPSFGHGGSVYYLQTPVPKVILHRHHLPSSTTFFLSLSHVFPKFSMKKKTPHNRTERITKNRKKKKKTPHTIYLHLPSPRFLLHGRLLLFRCPLLRIVSYLFLRGLFGIRDHLALSISNYRNLT